MSFVSARNRAGLSQAVAAEEIGVTKASISYWETGKNSPRALLLPKIAEVYKCTIEDLLAEEETQAERSDTYVEATEDACAAAERSE